MGKQPITKALTQAQVQPVTKQQVDHVWTETQINSLFDFIVTDPSYERTFFNKPKYDAEFTSSCKHEQKLCFLLLGKTDWMEYMIKENRVKKNTNGTLSAVNDWPMKMRPITKLFDKLHPQANTIKSSFGPYKSEIELQKYNIKGYQQWKIWQNQKKNTWYFKYVNIKIRLFPEWLNTGPFQQVFQQPTSTPIPAPPKTAQKVNTLGTAKSTSKPTSTSSSGSSSSSNSSITASSSTSSSDSTSDASSTSGSSATVPPKPTSDQDLQSYFTPDNGRQVPPHVSSQKPKLAEKITSIIATLNDISIEPPTDISTSKDQQSDSKDPKSSTVKKEISVIGDTNQEEFISAMLMLTMQELENKHSYCMTDIEIGYIPPLTLSEQAVLLLIRKMNGKITNISDSDTKAEFIRSKNACTKYILWNSTTQLEIFDLDKNDLPTPITLIGLVQLISTARKVELERKVVDLISLED